MKGIPEKLRTRLKDHFAKRRELDELALKFDRQKAALEAEGRRLREAVINDIYDRNPDEDPKIVSAYHDTIAPTHMDEPLECNTHKYPTMKQIDQETGNAQKYIRRKPLPKSGR